MGYSQLCDQGMDLLQRICPLCQRVSTWASPASLSCQCSTELPQAVARTYLCSAALPHRSGTSLISETRSSTAGSHRDSLATEGAQRAKLQSVCCGIRRYILPLFPPRRTVLRLCSHRFIKDGPVLSISPASWWLVQYSPCNDFVSLSCLTSLSRSLGPFYTCPGRDTNSHLQLCFLFPFLKTILLFLFRILHMYTVCHFHSFLSPSNSFHAPYSPLCSSLLYYCHTHICTIHWVHFMLLLCTISAL